MRFVTAIWKLLVGVKDALVLLFMLVFFGLLYAGLKSEPRSIGEGVLALRLDGALVEQAERPGAGVLAGGSVARQTELRDVLAALDAAKGDRRVKAVALDLDRFTGGGQVALADMGRAIDAFRKNSNKPVVAYATGYSSDSYQLAAHASEIWLSPLGAVAVAGPGGSNLYYKGLFDKLGVTAHVFKVGTYKAAVEPYVRADMSPEARENANALAGAIFEDWKQEVAKARPAATAGIERTLADPAGMATAAGGDLSKAALDMKLVDRLGERREFEARLAELGGKDAKTGDYKQVRFADYAQRARDAAGTGPIGVVHVAGMIVDGKAYGGRAGGDTIARLIDDAVAGGKLKALVVRIDSPGGSVTASERIRQSILGAKAAGLPVVVSMGSVAASGGYWITTPADYVFAEPETITGSIGVFGVIPTFEGALGKLGVTTDGIATTPLAGQPDILGGLNPQTEQLLQAGISSTYGRFLGLVAKARHKSPAEIDRIAQGRVWDGGTARQIGLVDGFGSLDSAVAKAAELAKLGDERGVTWIDKGPSFEEQLIGYLAGDDQAGDSAPEDAFAVLAPAPVDVLERALAEATAVLSGPAMQAVCLECPPPASPRSIGRRERTLLSLFGWGRPA